MNMLTRDYRCNDWAPSRILILLQCRGTTGNRVTQARNSVNLRQQQQLQVSARVPSRRTARSASVSATATQTTPVVAEGSRALSGTREYRWGAGSIPLVGTPAAGATRPAGPSTGTASAAGPRANRPSFHGTYEGQHLQLSANIANSATAGMSHFAARRHLPKAEDTCARGEAQ